MFDLGILAAVCAAVSAVAAAYVLADFWTFFMRRYRERFLAETAMELDDVLLSMPAGRILDLSVGLMAACGLLAALIVMSLAANPSWQAPLICGVVAGGAAFALPRLVLRHMRKRRLAKFNDQLENALNTMSGSLKAGFSILQALEEVAGGRQHPIAIEFRLLVQEIQLGVPLERALDNMQRRLESPDLELVTLAIITARQTGGELPAALDRLSGVIRERIRIQQKVRALTSMGRLQVIIISIMPFALLGGLMLVMPGAAEIFFGTLFGLAGLGVVVLLVIFGALMASRITRIDI